MRPSLLHCFLTAVAVVACAGCAALGGYAPPGPVHAMPDVLRAGADDRVTPVIQMTAKSGEGLASVRAVTLAEVLQTARADALAVLESAARLDAAAGMARAAAGALWPGVSVGLGASHLDGTQVGSFGEVRDVSFARLEPAATIFYHVNPVAAVARSDARRRDVDAAAMDVAEAERAAMLQGAVAYYDLLLASAARDVATVLLRDAEGFLAIAGARAEAEVGSGGEPTAFVCEGGVCELPTSDPDVFRGQIAKVKPLLDAPASDRSPGRRSW